MKPLMKPIDTPDQVFHDGDPSTGELGTICSAEWLNDTQASIRDIQAECIAILRANGFEPDETKRDQLWQSIQAAIKSQVPAATITTAGISLLSSSVTSNSETIAATSKAVKIAMDNANARLAKDRNLADLPSVPLALANLTLADVKKYVESTNTGVSKLPQFRPSSEDDLTSLPAGYMALVKNRTPGGPLPDENWFYLEVAGKLDNSSNNPNRKGAIIRLTQISTPEISWTGVKFDDGTTTTEKFIWSRDFNTLNKPKPADIGALDKNQNGADIPDKPGFIKNLGLAETVNLAAGAMQKSANGGDIQNVVAFRNALQLGTAALASMGVGKNQVLSASDSSFFAGGNGYLYIPCLATTGNPVKIMLQWGIIQTRGGENNIYNLPYAFPTAGLWVMGCRAANGYSQSMNVSIENRSQIRIQNWAPAGAVENCCFFAVGYL